MFSYENLVAFCKRMSNRVDVDSIGKSEWGYDIPYLHTGRYSGKQIIITGGIHAREVVSCVMCCMLCVKYSELTEHGIYFLPMLNPDGNLLVTNKAERENGYGLAVKINGNSTDFSLWKANGQGVDLNVNFDARWGMGKSNVFSPAPSDFVGRCPFSAKESRALAAFTKKVKPSATVSYHCKGRELYWYFFQKVNKARDERIAHILNRELNYKILSPLNGSSGGYKDWCVQKLAIPAFTIELCDDKYLHPLPSWCIIDEWNANKQIPGVLLESL